MDTKLLIIKTDDNISKNLLYILEQDDYYVELLRFNKGMMERIKDDKYDLVIMDIENGDTDGMKIIRMIREYSSVPIIIVSKVGDVMRKILALEYGADDYMEIPFNSLELRARIKVLLRRRTDVFEKSVDNFYNFGTFHVNLVGRVIFYEGKKIHLTGREYDLFYTLLSNPGKIFKREELFKMIWGFEEYGDLRTIDVHIKRIREKLHRVCGDNNYIMTKWGEGYYFEGDGNS